MPEIQDARILIMATDGFEESELLGPLAILRERGAGVQLAAPSLTPIQATVRDDPGRTIKPDLTIAEAKVGDYDALVLPGGVINPDALRPVDAVLLSHAHHDHLDPGSLHRIGTKVPLVVPRGVGRILARRGFRDVTELDVGDTLAIGASYQWNDRLSFDIAYTHIFSKETDIRILPGHQDFEGLPFLADVDSDTDIISAGLRYRWDDPKVAIPAVPLVRKY